MGKHIFGLLPTIILALVLAGPFANAADLKLKHTWAVSINNSGTVEPATLIFGVHTAASNDYNGLLAVDEGGDEAVFLAPPPFPGAPGTRNGSAVFTLADGVTTLSADMRPSAAAITWELTVNLDPNFTITLARTDTDLVNNDAFLTGRTLTMNGPNGFSADLDTGANVQITQSGVYAITCALENQQIPPVAVDDDATVKKGSANNAIAVLGNDFDQNNEAISINGLRPNDEAGFASPASTSVQGGTVTIVGSEVQYTPPVGFTGEDSFQYQISDDTDTAFATVTVQVQGIIATRTHAAGAALNAILTVTITLQYAQEDLYSMLIEEALPFQQGQEPPVAWQYIPGSLTVSSGALPTINQDENILTIDFGTNIPDVPSLVVTYNVQVPAEGLDQVSFVGSVKTQAEAQGAVEELLIAKTYLTPTLYHSADYNKNWQISVPELLRVLVLYNSGNFYKIEGSTADGFTTSQLNPGAASGYHSADYNKNWQISVPELLRVLALYNSGGFYQPDNTTADGYRPTP